MRGAWAEIDLRALEQNVAALRERAAGQTLMAVVKANAYGHGAVAVARAALQAGAGWLGVATLGEAEELRRAGIAVPIQVLGHLQPGELEAAARRNVSVTLSDRAAVDRARLAAQRSGRDLRVQIKVDTGMGRIGVRPDDVLALARQVASGRGLRYEGVFSHLSSADADAAYSEQQIERFAQVMRQLESAGLLPPWRHLLNSAGILWHSAPGCNLVRAGIAMYGLHPDGISAPPQGLMPVLSLRARVTFVKRVAPGTPVGYGRSYVSGRTMQVATIGVGYADGYRRGLSNRAQVLIGGRHHPVIGRVSMDQLTVGLPADAQVAAGDEAILIGRQGPEHIGAEELARLLDTISYEVVSGLSARLPRVERSHAHSFGG